MTHRGRKIIHKQCDLIGLFLKDLATIFLSKVVKIPYGFWGYLGKTIEATYGKIGLHFIS